MALMKRRAMAKNTATRGESPVLGEIKLTQASQKSYITARATSSDKWVHICSIYESQTPDHAAQCRYVFSELKRQPLDKSDACELKDRVVSGDLEIAVEDQIADSDAESDADIN